MNTGSVPLASQFTILDENNDPIVPSSFSWDDSTNLVAVLTPQPVGSISVDYREAPGVIQYADTTPLESFVNAIGVETP